MVYHCYCNTYFTTCEKVPLFAIVIKIRTYVVGRYLIVTEKNYKYSAINSVRIVKKVTWTPSTKYN